MAFILRRGTSQVAYIGGCVGVAVSRSVEASPGGESLLAYISQGWDVWFVCLDGR